MKQNVCRNKKCMKHLPDGYKHKYCEACRNQQVHTLKKGLKAAAGVTGTVACLVVTVMTAGEIDLKKIK